MQQILKRNGGLANFKIPKKGYILLETGYGPSGLPHIGTFGEVARTNIVRHAFHILTGRNTKLICFSDDMDGFRKVPENVPNQDLLQNYLDQPLTTVPDPFEKYDSFGSHNNAKLKEFLNQFGFEYEFISATDCYKSGKFDKDDLKKLTESVNNLLNDETLSEIAIVGNEFGATTGRTRKVNWLNLDKLINSINVSGSNIVIISKEDILLKIGKYKVIKGDKLLDFDSLDSMKCFIKNNLKNECYEIDKIIFSNNKSYE